MSPVVLQAIQRARVAATMYAVAWGAFLVSWLALVVASPAFAPLLDQTGRDDAVITVGVLALVAFPLPAIADAIQCVALVSLARKCGRKTFHPIVFVMISLVLPLVAAAAAVSEARNGVRSIDRVPLLPSFKLTVLIPVLLAIGSALVTPFIVAVSDPEIGPLVWVALLYLSYGMARIVLGLQLRSAFSEILSRPAVDEMHASRTEPVAGG